MDSLEKFLYGASFTLGIGPAFDKALKKSVYCVLFSVNDVNMVITMS